MSCIRRWRWSPPPSEHWLRRARPTSTARCRPRAPHRPERHPPARCPPTTTTTLRHHVDDECSGCGHRGVDDHVDSVVPATTARRRTPIVQPPQPVAGPGGSDYEHGDWRVGSGGEGADAWFVFQPVDPAPASAPVAIVMHGYFEYAGFDQMYEFIRHTVRHGTIVVYPAGRPTSPCRARDRWTSNPA